MPTIMKAKKFNGKIYSYSGSSRNKNDAEVAAFAKRKRGFLCRILKEKKGYSLWIRRRS